MSNKPMSNQLEKALAALIGNTKTHRRSLSLPDIAGWLEIAVAELGSLSAVADRISLSPGMLRQFLSINELTPEVVEMFRNRLVDSVDAASHLKTLDADSQIVVANDLAEGSISTSDVRAICEFRKEYPNTDIKYAIAEVKSSRNVKHYVWEFVLRGGRASEDQVTKRFNKVFSDDDIIEIKMRGLLGKLVLNESGKTRLYSLAKSARVSVPNIIPKIAMGELDHDK